MGKLHAKVPIKHPTKKVSPENKNKFLVIKRFFKYAEMGVIIATTSIFPVVSHWTDDAVTPYSSISVGKAIFVAVSVNKPHKINKLTDKIAMNNLGLNLSSYSIGSLPPNSIALMVFVHVTLGL